MLIAAFLLAAVGSLVCSATVFTNSIPPWVLAAAGLAMLVGYLVVAVLVVRRARTEGKSIGAAVVELLRATGRFLWDFMPA